MTPRVKNKDFYTFEVGAQKYKLVISANYTPLDPNTVVPGANFCVGQYIPFSGGFDPPLLENPVFGPIKWALGGTFVNDHTQPYPNGSDNYFMNPDKLTNPATYAWWVSGGMPKQYEARLGEGLTFANGQYVVVTGNGLFNMFRPQAKVTTQTTSVNVNSSRGYLALVFADSSARGITFYHTINTFGFSGSILWAQVVSSPVYQLQDTSSTWHLVTPNGPAPYGDDPIPYQGFYGPDPYDAPNLGLPSSGYMRAGASSSFEMWMMFQPPGGIWVPLRVVNWSWSGSATNGPSGWGLQSGNNSPNPTDFDTETYPVWNSHFSNSQWIPPLP